MENVLFRHKQLRPRQVQREIDRGKGISFGHGRRRDRKVKAHISRLSSLVRADLDAASAMIPKRGASRHQYIQFFEDSYSSLSDLVRDGLAAEERVDALTGQGRLRTQDASLVGFHRRLAKRLRALHEQLLSDAVSRLEADIASGLTTLEEARAYYWIGFILHTQVLGILCGFSASTGNHDYTIKRIEWEAVEKRANAALRLATKRFQRHLRTHPQDVDVLRLAVSAYRFLGRTDAQYKAEMGLKKAEATSRSSTQPLVIVSDRSGISFEMKCQRLFEARGFTTALTSATSDGGIDIVATLADPLLSGRYVIQCKDWQGSVGVKLLRELFGVVVSEDANKGILITSSEFTRSAIEFAKGKRLELIDGRQLDEMIGEASKGRMLSRGRVSFRSSEAAESTTGDSCLRCGSRLKRKTRYCTACGAQLE